MNYFRAERDFIFSFLGSASPRGRNGMLAPSTLRLEQFVFSHLEDCIVACKQGRK